MRQPALRRPWPHVNPVGVFGGSRYWRGVCQRQCIDAAIRLIRRLRDGRLGGQAERCPRTLVGLPQNGCGAYRIAQSISRDGNPRRLGPRALRIAPGGGNTTKHHKKKRQSKPNVHEPARRDRLGTPAPVTAGVGRNAAKHQQAHQPDTAGDQANGNNIVATQRARSAPGIDLDDVAPQALVIAQFVVGLRLRPQPSDVQVAHGSHRGSSDTSASSRKIISFCPNGLSAVKRTLMPPGTRRAVSGSSRRQPRNEGCRPYTTLAPCRSTQSPAV